MPGKSVLARYASVELVTEVDVQLRGLDLGEIDGGTRTLRGVEWVMVTSSSAGGKWKGDFVCQSGRSLIGLVSRLFRQRAASGY